MNIKYIVAQRTVKEAHSAWAWALTGSKIPKYTLLGNRDRFLHWLNKRSWGWLSEQWIQILWGGSDFATPKTQTNPPTSRWQFSNRVNEVLSLKRPPCTENSWQQPHLKRAKRMFFLEYCFIFFSCTVVEASLKLIPSWEWKNLTQEINPTALSHTEQPSHWACCLHSLQFYIVLFSCCYICN